MYTSARLIPPTGRVAQREREKIRQELIAKYAPELGRANAWQRMRLKLKIDFEVGRIFRHRLYVASFLLAVVLMTCGDPAQGDPPALQESAPDVKSALNNVITRQIAAFHAGDFARAYAFAATEIRSRYDQAGFEQMVKVGFPLLTRATSTEFGPALDDGENGVVYVKVSDAQGQQLYLYSLKREEKGWKVLSVSQKEEEDTDDPPPAAAPGLPPYSA